MKKSNELKLLNNSEILKIEAGCFAFDVGWAIGWFAGLQTGMNVAYEGSYEYHQH